MATMIFFSKTEIKTFQCTEVMMKFPKCGDTCGNGVFCVDEDETHEGCMTDADSYFL